MEESSEPVRPHLWCQGKWRRCDILGEGGDVPGVPWNVCDILESRGLLWGSPEAPG